MTVSQTFQLDVCDFAEAGFVDVLLELFELGLGAEEVTASLVEFGDLRGIENQCHAIYNYEKNMVSYYVC